MSFACTALSRVLFFFFFNDTATTEIYTLSLHDALPISQRVLYLGRLERCVAALAREQSQHRHLIVLMRRHPEDRAVRDRKSTRLNSSHLVISYAVFCLKKKKKKTNRY